MELPSYQRFRKYSDLPPVNTFWEKKRSNGQNKTNPIMNWKYLFTRIYRPSQTKTHFYVMSNGNTQTFHFKVNQCTRFSYKRKICAHNLVFLQLAGSPYKKSYFGKSDILFPWFLFNSLSQFSLSLYSSDVLHTFLWLHQVKEHTFSVSHSSLSRFLLENLHVSIFFEFLKN